MSWTKNSYIAIMVGLLLVGALALHSAHMYQVKNYLLIGATAIAGLPIAIKALRSLRAKAFSIELLLVISLSGATIIGEYTEAAVLGFLFVVGAWLETRALRKIRYSLKKHIDGLAQRFPDEAFAELLEAAPESETRAQQFLQRFANIYTPAIVVLAIVVYLISGNMHQALTFLVIACPGALVISVPVALAAGISNGASSGLLIKDGDTMEKLAKVDVVLFAGQSLAIQPEAGQVVDGLLSDGLKQVSIMSGDGLDLIKQLKGQGYSIAVVGDPVHNAAVLAAADVGVMLGSVAANADGIPDVVILSGQVSQLRHAYKLARATLRTMKQNTLLALGTVAILLAGVSTGTLLLAWGMLIHEVSVLMVILNAAGLIRYASAGKSPVSGPGSKRRPAS